ncbi:MAG TPA: TlpA disulfide reductase family protein [Acidimicrobiales bacterium]|nr:TlpA disulfide reductase family protein [Acidimicrobiales bacterium]
MTLLDAGGVATGGAAPAPPRRRHTARWIAGVVLVAGAGLVALLATRPPQAATEVDTPLVGQQAPAIDGPTLSGGSFDLAALRGRWVVVNFFASWCPPCQQEEPDLVAFAFAHRAPTAAALVGVVFNDTAGSARAFMRSEGATWPAVVDGGGQIALAYGVVGPPETFIIAPDGRVVVHLDGPVTASSLDGWLARARQGST